MAASSAGSKWEGSIDLKGGSRNGSDSHDRRRGFSESAQTVVASPMVVAADETEREVTNAAGSDWEARKKAGRWLWALPAEGEGAWNALAARRRRARLVPYLQLRANIAGRAELCRRVMKDTIFM